MKILQLFGLGNTATLLTVGLRRLGVDCDMLLSNRHFITQYPKWTSNYPELEERRPFMWDKSDMRDPMTVVDLLRFCRKYDFIVVHPPGTVYSWMIGRKYAVWDGGSGNFIINKKYESPVYHDRLNHESARRGYKDSSYVFCNDINVIYQILQHTPWMHDKYGPMPLPVDTDVFKPMKTEKEKNFTAYLPTRNTWIWKGFDDILRGWKMFIEDVPDAKLYITYYGQDAAFTEVMTRYLGIDHSVEFIKLVPKPEFARLINACDVIIDQVYIGAIGGVTVQSMACGKPVIVNANQRWYNEQYGEGVPVLNARTASQVYSRLIEVYHNSHKDIGKQARDYVVRNHNYERVAAKVLDKIDEILC